MKLDCVVSVWGAWHIDMLARAMLPSLLAGGNLPALVRAHDVRLRVLTRRADCRALQALPIYQRVAALARTSIEIASDEDSPDASQHLAWWGRVAGDARSRRANVLVLHPDVVWSDGSLLNLADAFARGNRAVLMPPNMRVVSETLIPVLDRWRSAHGGVLEIAPQELVGLGVDHLHPLTALATEGAPGFIPALEHLWPVVGEGFVLCQAARPVLAYDPAKCDLTEKFFVMNASSLDDVHAIRDSDDIFFLSLAPLAKDFGLIVWDHRSSAYEIARWSAHPYNDIPLNRKLAQVSARLHYTSMSASRWRRAERRARVAMGKTVRWREIVKLIHVLRDLNCKRASQVLALAADVLDLPRLLRSARDTTVLAPTDSAVASLPRSVLYAALAAGGEAALAAWLIAHAARGRHTLQSGPEWIETHAGERIAFDPEPRRLQGSIPITRSVSLADHMVHVIDGVLSVPKPPSASARRAAT